MTLLEFKPFVAEPEKPIDLKPEMSKRQFGMLRRQVEETQRQIKDANKKKIIRENKYVYGLRVSIKRLLAAERQNNGEEFHKWFWVTMKNYSELEKYLAEKDDETRCSP